jgi:uncharacterized protein YdeI (BOF family)
MKQVPAAVAISGLALLLASLGQTVHADNFIDAPRPLVVSYESTGRTSLVAAGADISIHNLNRLPDGRRVRLNGTVEAVQGKRDFILRDDSGHIEINLTSHEKIALTKGAEVTVSGRINRGLMGVNIDASSVTLRSKSEQAAAEKPLDSGLAAKAPAYTVATLPETGFVKVTGTVTTSENDREFVMKDATGLVDVSVADADASKVMKGSRVTVIGSVDRGVLGKDISASRIVVENPIVASVE